jgi:DNA-binding transcriptional regulator YdaS (Cro superfamily)
MKAITRAIQRLTPPTQAELARVTGQKPQAVNRWVKTGSAPAKHCIAIEQATGVSRHDLRADVFGLAPKQPRK